MAIRRTNIGQDPGQPNLLDALPPSQFTILPNTAGCYSADDAVRTLRLARELLDGHNLVKLEVLGDRKTLYPDMVETLRATEVLAKHDENYMPPVAAEALKRAQPGNAPQSMPTLSEPSSKGRP